MIRLIDLLLENNLREYSDEEKRQMGIPPKATSRGGVWYVGDKYAGQVVNGKFVAAAKTQSAGKKPPKDKTKAKVATTLPSFKKFKDSMLGAGRSATKQEWHRELDRIVVSAYEKQNPPTKMPPEAVSTTEEEKQDFESRLKKLGMGDVAAPPRTSSGIVNPKFMKAMIDHQKQFPYSKEISNRFGGAGGENPIWMPRVYT